MRAKWGKLAWGRYGFVDAFHPAANWYDPDVLGIDQDFSNAKAREMLGWEPRVDYPAGLRETVAWLRSEQSAEQ